jgi:putative transposase
MTVGAANVGKNIVMILDNFPSHKAKIARQYAEDFGINLVYLPPYSPDLNPIEFIWKSIKREVSCEFIRDVDHLKNMIKENFYKFSARRSFATNWIKVFLGNELSVISWVNDYNSSLPVGKRP